MAQAPDVSNPSPKTDEPRHASGGMLKPILLGAAILILLPVTAIIGTVVYSNMSGAATATTETAVTATAASVETVMNGMNALAIAYAPAVDDPERQAARRKIDGVMFRMNTGTMSAEEGKYWASHEGQMELVEANKTAIDLEGLRALGKELYIDK